MKASYQHISHQHHASFQLDKFDASNPCIHDELHFHEVYEIVYVKNGRGKIAVENKQMPYEDGALIFLGPCIPHLSFSNKQFDDNFEIVIHFEESFVQERIALFSEFSALLPLIIKSKSVLVFAPTIKAQHDALFAQLLTQRPQEQLVSLLKLLSDLSSTTQYQCLLDENIGERYAQSKQVKKIFAFIKDKYCFPISTKDAAQHVGLTPNSFCRVFKKLTHKSFITFLNEYRIRRAAKLLEETEDSITEIVFKCGFENPSYFSKVFQQVQQCTPWEYRKHYGRGQNTYGALKYTNPQKGKRP